MAAATLTAGAAPLFLSKNYLNRFADVSITSGTAYAHRPYDMTRSSYWVSDTGDDGTTEVYEAALKEGEVQTARSIDFVALLGINLKNFLLEYSANNGASWSTFAGLDYSVGTADFSGTDKIVSNASPVDANRIRLTMWRTQDADDPKQVAEFIVAGLSLQPTRGMFKYQKSYADNVKTVEMADGSLDYTYVYRSDDSFEFFRAALSFAGVAQSERDSLRSIKASPEPFLFMPEPGDVPADVFLCRFAPDSYTEQYLTAHRGAGYMIDFEVEEIGGG